jgi:formylglycine-generating enzyme required for sulfatase activity
MTNQVIDKNLPNELHLKHLISGLSEWDLDFVLVREGSFDMGSETMQETHFLNERPVHKVIIPNPFYMAKYPCTQRLWELIMHDNPTNYWGPDISLTDVTWINVQDFIDKLNEILRNSENPIKGFFRLPGEAEWEYAAKGGPLQCNFQYSGSDKLNEVGWFTGNCNGHPWPLMGIKRSNTLGLYHMSGNVWEWCEDIWESEAYKARIGNYLFEWKPQREKNKLERTCRGGSWEVEPKWCRIACRGRYIPTNWNFDIGFRLVFDPITTYPFDK